MKRRILSAVLVFCFLLALFPVSARAAKIVASGGCGAENIEDLIWTLDENGLLTFIGSGAMADYDTTRGSDEYYNNGYRYDHYTNAPWYPYRSQIKSVEIPSGVTHVGQNAFRGNIPVANAPNYRFNQLTSVTLAESVESIGDGAFQACTALVGVTLSNALTRVGADAFRSCSKLTDIALKESVVSIGANAFNGCAALETLTIPGSVTEIGESAFANCPKLTVSVHNSSYGWRYVLTSNVRHTIIGDEKVYIASGSCGAENLTDLLWRVDVDGTMTFIGSGAMADYNTTQGSDEYYNNGYRYDHYTNAPWYPYRSQIKSVEIPSGVTHVGQNAFRGNIPVANAPNYRCDQLTSVTLAESVESIGDGAFQACTALVGVTLSNALTSVGADAFRACSALTDISLKENVVSIGANAFNGCAALETLTIPDSVTEIGGSAFADCSKLTVPVHNNSYGWRYVLASNVRHTIIGNETVYVASGSCGAKNPADLLWRVDENGLLTFIGNGAMADYNTTQGSDEYYNNGYRYDHYTNAPWYLYRSQIKSVEIPSGVTHVGQNAFRGNIPVTNAPNYRFDQLTSVTLAESVESIGDGAFQACTALVGVTLSNALTSVGADAFRSCSKLTDISLKENVSSIGANAFNGCAALETLTIPGSVTEIGESAFANCPKLTATVYEGSYARRYCLLNSVPHNAVDPNTYTITFHPNGGEGEPVTKTLTGLDTVYGELPTPTRDGYAFMGWHTATEGGEQITPETKFQPRRNRTFYAVWAKPYTITFDPNGGEVSRTDKTLTDKDTVYGELPAPTREGYTFEGWHTAANNGEQITADTTFDPKRDQTLYAVWSKIVAHYTVTLEENGGSVSPGSVTVDEGGTYGALPEPSRDGCAFLGWYTEPSGGTQVTSETEVRLTANQTLYAHWVATNAPEFSSNGAAVTDIREMSSETELEGKFTVADAENPDVFRTATAFCALYDSDGLMVHLQSWEVDVSDTRNIRFTGSVRIPEGAQVSEIKIMVLSDELVPLQAAGTL